MATRNPLVLVSGVEREIPAMDTLPAACLPIATSTAPGIVKAGSGLAITSDGTLSAAGGSTPSYLGGGVTPRAGQWYGALMQGSSAQGFVGLWATPVRLGKTASVNALQCKCVTAPSSAITIRMGIYADDGSGNPAGLLVDGGPVSVSATEVYTSTLGSAVSLPPGLYWFTLGMPNPWNGVQFFAAGGYQAFAGNYDLGWVATWDVTKCTVGIYTTNYNGGALPTTFGSFSYAGPGGEGGVIVLAKFA